MKVKVQLMVSDDDGPEETVTEGVVLEKPCPPIEPVGLTLTDAKTLLTALPQRMVERPVSSLLAMGSHCHACGTPLRPKGHHPITFRPLFGTLKLQRPRLHRCACHPQTPAPFSPLTTLLPEHTAPEFLFMETKWASLVSCGLTAQARKDFLPVETSLSVSTVRTHALAVAERCEAELADERMSVIDRCPRD
jgi:hypothetical protein